MSASADWRKRGAENRPYQMCPCGRGRFFCVIFHTYKLTQPSLGCSPGDGCVVISLKWIYFLLRPPCLPEIFRFRSAIFRSEEERNCLSLSSKVCSAGSGGAAGLGLGSSRQKHLFVPEPQNDFIFSILCEELGFVGACAVILLFALLLWRGITLAAHAPDRFGALLVVGFVVQVALQAVLNMAVVTNTIPNTGISLPFFSSGGTSLMMLLGEMGIVLSVSRGET